MSKFSIFIGTVADLLYPPESICILCGSITQVDNHLCADCAAGLRTIDDVYKTDKFGRCQGCSRPVKLGARLCNSCKSDEHPVRGFAPFMHNGIAAKLVTALKFHNQEFAAGILAPYMVRYIPEGINALVPIPLHRLRRRERGFNQAELLCREMSRICSLPTCDVLLRARKTKRQTDLSGDVRRLNVEGAFTMTTPLMDLHGMNIALIDDVRTTGSTALAASLELREHGAGEVTLITATLSK